MLPAQEGRCREQRQQWAAGLGSSERRTWGRLHQKNFPDLPRDSEGQGDRALMQVASSHTEEQQV